MRNRAVDYMVNAFDPQTLVEAVRQYLAMPASVSGAEPVAEKSPSQFQFELANGGTILLIEISVMDIGLRARILRVL